MSLRFIYGRAGSGKTYYCLNEIKSCLKDEKEQLILLVPEDFSFQAEKELLRTVGDKGITKAKVLSFKRMAYAVFSQVGGLTRKYMNSAGKAMLIYRLMEKYQDEFKIFTKAVKMQGFVDTVSDIIAELKIYGITPETLHQAVEMIENDYILKSKLEDIDLIFSKFEEALHQNYIDPEDDLTILAEKMDSCTIFDGARVWVDGFSMFTPQQYMVLQKLLKKGREVSITLCTDCMSSNASRGRAALFSSSKSIEEKLLKIVRENNISLEKPVELDSMVSYKFKSNGELCHIEKNIYSYPWEVYEDKTRYISIFKSVNRYSEVENTARDIIRLCRDEGLRFGEIAVVTRDVEGYERLAAAVFSEYSIPFFIDRKRDINGNPLVVLILSAIEILSRNWTYESVFRYLKTGLLEIDMKDIDLIENYVLASGIKGRRWTQDNPWEYWPDRGFEGEMPEDAKDRLLMINDIRNTIRKPLMDLHGKIKERKNARDICTALFEFLCEIGVPERIDSLIEEFKEEKELTLAGEYSKVWNIMIETLDQIVEVLGDDEMPLEQFIKVLTIGFSEYKIGLIPPALDQVVFGSVEKIKSHSVKALYVLGVNDGVFPSNGGDEGVLSDDDRESLKSLGIELAPGTRDRMLEEDFMVYTTFTRTDKYLRISYPIADYEGRTMRPSLVVAKLRKIFPNIAEYSNITNGDKDEDNLNMINGPVPTFNELVWTLRKSAEGASINPLWNDVYCWYMEKEDWREKCSRALLGLTYNSKVKPISPLRVRELYGKQLRFSISRLEKYAQCPFAYFVQYGLKAKERKVYEFSPPDFGSFIHSVLDGFAKYLEESNLTWRELEKEKCSKIVSDLVDREVDRVSGSILSSSARYKYLKERLKKIVLRAVWLIALHIKRGGFEPSGYEVAFEKGGKYPPISIELPSGEKLSLIGRIDRVDTYEDEEGIYVRVVDYKTGNKRFNLSDIYNGLELQLLIYLDAILEYASKNSKKPIIPGGILYFRIDDPIINSEGELTEEEVEKEIMKNLKMKGLLLSDVKVVKQMDREIDGHSVIIPVMIKKDGESFGSGSSVASMKDFEGLRKHVRKTIINICEDMLQGNISISPYKKKSGTPCEYCSYRSICRFDVTIKENSYRIISDKKNDEIWDAVRQVKSGEGGSI